MESILHKKIKNKVKRWSKGFADENRPFMYEESYKVIEQFLESSKGKNDFIKLGGRCELLSAWYSADFLERYLNNKADSVCQFVIKMFSAFYHDKEILYEFPKPLNEIYTNFLTDLMDETKKDIHDSVNQACEFHVSRTKMYQEFDTETKMVLPSEILAPLLLRKRIGLDVENMEHPLICDLFPVIEGLSEVDTDPVFLKVMKYV